MLFALGVPQRWLHTAQFPLPYCPCVLCAKRKFRKYFTPMIIRLIDGAVCFSRNRSAHTTTTAHNLNGSLLVAWFSAFICHSINMTRWLGWNLEKNNNEPFHGSRSHRSASSRTSKRESSYSRPSGFFCCFFFSSPLLFFCTVLMIDIRFMFLRKLVCFLYYTECRCAIRATMKWALNGVEMIGDLWLKVYFDAIIQSIWVISHKEVDIKWM